MYLKDEHKLIVALVLGTVGFFVGSAAVHGFILKDRSFLKELTLSIDPPREFHWQKYDYVQRNICIDQLAAPSTQDPILMHFNC